MLREFAEGDLFMAIWDEFLSSFPPYVGAAVAVGVVVVVGFVLERLIARYMKRVARQKEWPPHVANGLLLVFRLMILLGAVATLLRIGEVPTESIVAFSALGGAAVGFASTRTLGNIIAGAFCVCHSTISCQ